MKKLLKGGVIVGASGCRKADLLIDGERIEAVGEALSCPEAEEIDVSGKLLFPGFLDAHTHFDLEVCNTVTADDFYTGGRSALRGGTTTVIDFACPNKGETLHTGLARWHEKADGKTGCEMCIRDRRYRRNWCIPFYRRLVPTAGASPGAACRSPTKPSPKK